MSTGPYLIRAVFVIEAASAGDAEEAVRSARLDDDLAPRWICDRTWWSGETGTLPVGRPDGGEQA